MFRLRCGKRTLCNILLELSHCWMVKYENPNRHIAGFTVCSVYFANSPWERRRGKGWGREAGMVVRVTRRCHLQKKLCTMLQRKYFQPNTTNINVRIYVVSLQPLHKYTFSPESVKASSVRGREEMWPKKENIGFLRIGTRQSCSWRETQKCKRILGQIRNI